MGFKFNPFSGNFDQTGSGGGATVFDGEVQFFSDLPQTVGTPPVNSAYLVRESEGTIWFGNKKQKGIYIRSGNSGVRNDDWTYGGEYPVTSVNGATGAVTVAAATHAAEHEAGEADEIKAMAALVATDVNALNGVYFHDGTLTSGRPNFFKTGTRKNTKLVYNSGTNQWNLVRNLTVEAVGADGPGLVPWDLETWEQFAAPTTVSVTRLGLEDMTQKLAETGGAATATTSEDGLMSSADKTKLNGIAANATANTASSATPSALGTASAGSATDYARADHAHSAEVSDSAFRVLGSTDATKKVAIEVDTNVPANTTVTLTAPSSGGTIALAGAAPSTHAASHAAAGSDPLFDQNLNTGDIVSFSRVETTDGAFGDGIRFDGNGIIFDDNTAQTTAWTGAIGSTAGLPLKTGTGGIVEAGAFGTSAGQFAEGNHTHSQLHDRSHAIASTSDHTATAWRVFYSNGSGEVTELALGSSGQVLTSNGASAAPSFAAASGGVSAMQSIAINFVLN